MYIQYNNIINFVMHLNCIKMKNVCVVPLSASNERKKNRSGKDLKSELDSQSY